MINWMFPSHMRARVSLAIVQIPVTQLVVGETRLF